MSELLNYLVENDPNFRRARLPALYSDFRSLSTINPDGFKANLAAWKHGLASACLAGAIPSKTPARNHLILALDDSLLRALDSKQFGQPLALGTVVADALANRELMPMRDFLNSKETVLKRNGWGMASIPFYVASWALRQVGLVTSGTGDDRLPNGQFVILENLEEATRLYGEKAEQCSSRFERTFSKAQFQRQFAADLFGEQKMSATDIDVILKFLSRDKDLIVVEGKTVKIKSGSGELEDAKITEEDSAIASLKELMEDLHIQTGSLNKKIEELSTAAKNAVSKKNKISAMAALRSKKLAETNLARQYATLGQLEEVAAKIEQAADNVQLVKVMQSSASALRGLNTQVGGADKVGDVLSDLRDQMSEADEVGMIIAEGGQQIVIDEGEVDEEFEAMLAAEKTKEEERETETRAKEAEREKKERDLQQEKEAEETRRRLEALERLGPVPASAPRGEQAGENQRADTPVTQTAKRLDEMLIDENHPQLA